MSRFVLGRSKVAVTSGAVAAALLLAACGGDDSSSDQGAGDDTAGESTTITVEATNGSVEVPVEPQRVVALDNTSMQTLKAFGVEPVAVPKPLIANIPEVRDWHGDDSILDAGLHHEPQLEAVSEAEPDLIIGGYRFSQYTDDLEKIATTIEITPGQESPGEWVEGLKNQTEILGEIFNKQDEAAAIIEEFDAAVAAATEATSGETVFLGAAGGGSVDNGAGRIGRIIAPLDLSDVFADEDLDSGAHHNDSGLAPETVAQYNPDWMIAFDFDAATGTEGASPAREIIDSQEAWADTTFVQEDQIIILPTPFYVTEGIHAYTEVYRQIADAFTGAA